MAAGAIRAGEPPAPLPAFRPGSGAIGKQAHREDDDAGFYNLHGGAPASGPAEPAKRRGVARFPVSQRAIFGQIVRSVRAPMNSPRCWHGAIAVSISLAAVPTRASLANTCWGATISSSPAASRTSGPRTHANPRAPP